MLSEESIFSSAFLSSLRILNQGRPLNASLITIYTLLLGSFLNSLCQGHFRSWKPRRFSFLFVENADGNARDQGAYSRLEILPQRYYFNFFGWFTTVISCNPPLVVQSAAHPTHKGSKENIFPVCHPFR